MSYLVIARKFRPSTFDEVVGQEHITRTLKNAIASDRVGHAFLFSGPRGVGKTTTARILAKALNCTQGPTPTPCNECSSCQQISAGNYMDVVEIDGASNNSVDDIRDLREKVRYAPSTGQYKIYIIDEVHMLSNSAFNALLKTLEEPPPHVKFVFATTEPHKVPATILSRCQRFDFKRVSLADIITNLSRIAEKEGIQISRGSLHKVARAAEGSLRDAQSILDQVVSSSGQQVEAAEVDRVLGLVDRALVEAVAAAVLNRDGARVLQLIEQLVAGGVNPVYFAQQLMGHFRNLLLLKLCQQPAGLLEVTDEELKILQQQAAEVSPPELIQLVKIMLEDEELLRRALNSRVVLEVLLLKLTEIKPLLPVEDILAKLARLEAGSASQPRGKIPAIPAPLKSVAQPESPAQPASVPAVTGQPDNLPRTWQQITTGVRKRKPPLGYLLEHGEIVDFSEQEIVIGFEGDFFREQAEETENRRIIEGVIKESLGPQIKLRFAQKLLKKKASGPGSADNGGKTSRMQQIKEPLVEKAVSLFDARVIAVKEIKQQTAMEYLTEDVPEIDAEVPVQVEQS
jgi:DNA polymerase-3 subunit gamma/tau